MKFAMKILSLSMLAAPLCAFAQEWSSTIDGVTAYFGVVPSALARDWLTPHGASERDAHGRTTAASADHHFLVSLFDATGKRIDQAEVHAAHTPDPGRDGAKPLDSMRIADTTTFGNFFALGSETQRFAVTVRLPDRPKPLTFTFVYQPGHERTP